MKKVLIVSYIFPPAGGVGIQRTVKFVKYLPQFNWQSVVLTAKKKNYHFYDTQIFKDLPAELFIYKVPSFEPENYSDDFEFKDFFRLRRIRLGRTFKKLGDKLVRNFFRLFDFSFTPDEKTGWIIPAVLKGAQLVVKNKIDLVYVTGDPFSSFFIGHYIKKLTRVPFVADFRDEWTQGYLLKYYQRKYKWQPKIEAWQEKVIVGSADAVISVTPSIVENFKNNYPQFKEKFHCIPNGFDEDDFTPHHGPCGTEEVLAPAYGAGFTQHHETHDAKFTILHSGKVYSLRSPETFLKAVEEAIKEIPEIKDDLKIVFLGEISPDCRGLFDNLLSQGVLELKSFSPYKESINFLQSSDIALLILDQAPEAKRVYTAKVFDYLGAKKPVLAIASEESEAAKLIKQTNSGVMVQTPKEIKNQIISFYNLWKSKQLSFNGNEEIIRQFTRKNLTEKLANVFDGLTLKDF